MMIITIFLIWIAAYLVGAIPFSFIIGKMYGVDIRIRGSGNIGATNVARLCGRQAGFFAYFLDIFKGVIVSVGIDMYWQHGLLASSAVSSVDTNILEILLIMGYLLPIVGHMFPVYLRFRGGKGVSVALGIFIWLLPIPIF